MIPGKAISVDGEENEHERYCEIVRIFHADGKVLVRFPGNPRVYVKSAKNVRLSYRGRYTGFGGGGPSLAAA